MYAHTTTRRHTVKMHASAIIAFSLVMTLTFHLWPWNGFQKYPLDTYVHPGRPGLAQLNLSRTTLSWAIVWQAFLFRSCSHFLFSFFRTASSDITQRNSTKLGYRMGNEPHYTMSVRNLGVPSPWTMGPKIWNFCVNSSRHRKLGANISGI